MKNYDYESCNLHFLWKLNEDMREKFVIFEHWGSGVMLWCVKRKEETWLWWWGLACNIKKKRIKVNF